MLGDADPHRPVRRLLGMHSGVVHQLAALVLLFVASGNAFADRNPHILIVSMSDAVFPAARVASEALLESLEGEFGAPVVINAESLDASENLGLTPADEAREAARLAEKFGGMHTDLLVASGSVALDFLLRHRAAIAPAAPIVYYLMSDRRRLAETLGSDIGGIAFHWDVAGTLELALQLQPEAPEVVYIAGVAPYDEVFEELFDEAIARRAQPIRVTKLIGRPLAELQTRVAAAPRDAIVLYTTMRRDAAGVRYRPSDVVRPLAESSAAPIYTITSSFLGRGALGGSVVDFEQHGREAGRYIARILKQIRGSQPLSVERRTLPSTCLIDEQQLEHWEMRSARPPAHCKLLQEAPLALSSRATVVAGGATVLLVTFLVAAALVQQRKRRVAQQEAAHAARLAIIGEISASIMHEVTQPLSAILSNADAAEMLLGHKNPSVEKVLEVLADIRRDNARAHQIVMQLRSLLRKGEMHIEQLDLNELTSSAVALIRAEAARRETVIEHRPEPNLPPVAGDAVHLQQVILNVLVNALDAMEGAPAQRRRLEISTAMENGHSVCLRVRDFGAGISPSALPRLFESFYTTKRNGMGLGLSIAKTIVDAHRGTIRAGNTDGGGAEFRITLPIYKLSLSQH